MIYLDNNATTMVAPEVKEAMLPYLSEDYGNPSTLYDFGKKIRRVIEEARAQVAELLGARSEREVVFTSGGTESNHTAIFSALRALPARKRIVTTQVEHSSVLKCVERMSGAGYQLTQIGVSPSGAFLWDDFERALSDDVAVVSIMWANNETGVLFPIERIASAVKERGILIHVDAVQAVGKFAIKLDRVPIDYLSCSAHKFHGPKGIGGLYVREGSPYFPLFVGGRQERDRRAGTENVPGIIGLACALKLAVETPASGELRIQALRERLEQCLVSEIAESFVNGRDCPRISNTANITIPKVDSEALLIRLGQAGIAASSGSACLTGALEASHVLKAMGHSDELAMSSLRFSLSRYTMADELESALRIIPEMVSEIRAFHRREELTR